MNGFPFESEGFNTNEGVQLVRIRDLMPGTTDTFYSGPNEHQAQITDDDVLIGMDGDFNVCWWTG
jgi:type I restriction enzyme S subunit